MSSDEPRTHWLEIHGNRDDLPGPAGARATVSCPFRGECPLSVCLDCTDFVGLDADDATGDSYAVCRKAEPVLNPREALLETQLRAPDGAIWKATAYTRQRHDGTWDGWLDWLAPDGRTTRCGGCETNERSRVSIVAWARGLSAWGDRALCVAHEALRDET